ncbi:JmjC-domain-containing protein [Hesseltinella vesiculosa]|uniref:[histone H3]-trimethyl-L-lysine(9) demethylase n=1 Tax=Hesseltinella vesiculosa TaxID=101127 RepID=A0A1X2GJ47_9FUNG|nr:JmjC-domain-containing protein [Hesseltinella vesiculosa]
MDQFQDFYAFMEAIDVYGKEAGIAKVIPPDEWHQQLPSIETSLQNVRVHNPIVQHIFGSQGTYQQTNVEKRRPFTLNQWHALCQQDDYRTPDLSTTRTSRLLTKKRRRSTSIEPVSLHDPTVPHHQRYPKRLTTSQSSTTHLRSPPPSPDLAKRTKREIEADEIATALSESPVPLDFELHEHNESLYTDDHCKELERIYWRNLTFNPPMYGADMCGSLFDDSVKAWNVAKLPNLLNQIGVSLPGVNTPYLYFGMWKATFPWHVEDMDLYSINYLHFGAPKQWYAIPGSSSKKFERVMQNTFFQQSKACPEFLRHKTHLASPSYLANNGIPVHRCVQHQGEFMITFPFGYHSGYNLGLNCAESVNFALKSWVDIGRQAKACHCITDSVVIDMSVFDDKNPSQPVTTQANKKRPRQPRPSPSGCILCCNETIPTDMITSDHQPIHQLCAESIPETYLEQTPSGQSVVAGIQDIHPSRWKLTCLFCHKKKGACMQCCFGKCWRSFHATCAQAAGATLQRNVDRVEATLVIDGYCPPHDPKRREEKAQAQEQNHKRIMDSLPAGQAVMARYPGAGEYFGTIDQHVPEKRSCRIKFPDGTLRTVLWSNLTLA